MLRNSPAARLIIVAALISGVTVACSSAATEPITAPARAHLLGSWNFVRGCGGLAGQCSTTTAMPTRYVFRADDSVEAYRDGQRLFVLNYLLAPGAEDSTRGDTRPLLLIGAGPAVDPMPLRVSFRGDTALVLDEGCCDRFAFEYRRQP
jgi:hypothetical protein